VGHLLSIIPTLRSSIISSVSARISQRMACINRKNPVMASFFNIRRSLRKETFVSVRKSQNLYRQTFVKVPNMRFDEYLFSAMRTDGYDEVNCRFLQLLCERIIIIITIIIIALRY
jgi:hypothetical protein